MWDNVYMNGSAVTATDLNDPNEDEMDENLEEMWDAIAANAPRDPRPADEIIADPRPADEIIADIDALLADIAEMAD